MNLQTRQRDDGTVYRQKKCPNGHRFATSETPVKREKTPKLSPSRYALTLANMPLKSG